VTFYADGGVHRFDNESDRDARMLIFFSPGGLEGLFEEAGTEAKNAGDPIAPFDDEQKKKLIGGAEGFGIELVAGDE